jgi:hypothetical protein
MVGLLAPSKCRREDIIQALDIPMLLFMLPIQLTAKNK